ncbi:MAG: hypothetical protein U5L45_20015 [Saprospiraceae bacterium]|nr:hypothetical protein [Saprospiraceae bacterium]
MWFVFRLRRKTNHVSSLLRERSEQKTSVFNQKTASFITPTNSVYTKRSNMDTLI